jgi:hypothetical protein
MFSLASLSSLRFALQFSPMQAIRRCLGIHQNHLDLEEMPEAWRRDIGLLDGRDRCGEQNDGGRERFRVVGMISLQRNL